MRFTQQILGRSAKPALEDEDVIDQNSVDSMTEEAGEGVDINSNDNTAVPEDDIAAGDVVPESSEEDPAGAEEVIEETAEEVPAETGEEVVPPSADDAEGDVNPTTNSGEVTLDQVEAVVDGDAEAAAAAVAAVDTVDGDPTTPEEVIEEVAEQNAEAADDDVIPEPEAPEDTPVEETEVNPGEEEEVVTSAEEPVEGDVVPEAETQETDSEQVVDVQDPAGSDETPDAVEGDPATEDCACEEGGENPGDTVVEGEGNGVDENSDSGAAGTTADENIAPEESPAVVVEVGPESDAPGEPISEVIDEEGTGDNATVEETVETDSPVEEAVEEDVDLPEMAVSDVDDAQEVLSDAIDTYPQVVSVLEESLDNGGVSVECMRIINLFTQRDGIPLGADVALESFNHTARTQTRIAVESLKENIVEWIKKFVENFKQQALAMINTIKSHFDKIEIAKKKIAAIKEKISAGAGSTEGEVSFRHLSELTVDNSLDSVIGDLSNLVTFAKSFLALIGTHGQSAAKEIGALDISASDVGDKIQSVLTGFVQSNVKGVLNEVDNGYTSNTLPGETKAVADVELQGSSDVVTSLKFTFRKNEIESPVSTAKALSVSDVEKLVELAEALIAIIESSKPIIENAEKVVDSFSQSWNSSIDNKEEDGAKLSQTVKTLAKLTTDLAVTPVVALDTYLLRTVIAAADYAQASLK